MWRWETCWLYGEVRLECPEYLQAVLRDVGGHDGRDGYDDCLHDASGVYEAGDAWYKGMAAYTAAAISAKTLTPIRMVFLMAALFMYRFASGG